VNVLETETSLIKKIDSITPTSYKPFIKKMLKDLVLKNPENTNTICEYIIAEQTEFNIKESTKYGKLHALMYLSQYLDDKKSFIDMTKQDILNHLNSLRNSNSNYSRDNDTTSTKWIGTYNYRQMVFLKFFRWLYNQNESDPRKRITPDCMKGIKKLPRKDKTTYNSGQIWNQRENSVFLKYCPLSRDRCYHAMAMDTSCRPHELLGLKIKDLEFNVTEDGKQYAMVRIRDGKTGSRNVPIIDALPYVKEWIQQEHPFGSNLESWLFVSTGNNHGVKLGHPGVFQRYKYYKQKYFPSLLLDPTLPEPDKSVIRNMLTKPFNPYILRHSSLTEKSQYLTEAVLRNHAGWTADSAMTRVYTHLKDESSKILLEKKGILTKQDKEMATMNKSKICNNCNEANRPDAKWCMNCKMVLSYSAYNETLEKQKEKDNQITNLQNQVQMIMDRLDKLVTVNDAEKQTTKRSLAKDFGDNKMYMPSPEYKNQVFPLADIDEEIFYEICKDHNPMTCKEPECVQYQKEELDHKRRMEELRRRNPTTKKSKHIFPL